MRATYKKYDIESFGEQLLRTNDLDPIYVGLVEMHSHISRLQMYRLLLSYWCFYDIGAACYLSEFEGEGYWNALSVACENLPAAPSPLGMKNPVNGNWPRGKERRHFRGKQAIAGYNCLRSLAPSAEDLVMSLFPEPGAPFFYSHLLAKLEKWRGFGPWISYKIGDMLDRCLGLPVVFEYAHVMYSEPYKAAVMQWKMRHDAPMESSIDDENAAVKETVRYLVNFFGGYMAPPSRERPVGMQEIETILCKWKSHISGSYPLYNDIDEINHGVQPWIGVSTTAACLQTYLPKRKIEEACAA